MERLTRLRDLLTETVMVMNEVGASGGLLERLRAEDARLTFDQRGWGHVCDSLAVALEAGEMGSVRQSLNALVSALEV